MVEGTADNRQTIDMIIGVIGKRGEGKTLSCVKDIVKAVRAGRTVYTNFNINKKEFTESQQQNINILDYSFFRNYKDFQLNNCLVCIDEIYVYIDSRASMSKRNKIMSYFFNQTRKRDVDLYYTTQFIHQIDKRLRSNTEVFIFPEKRIIKNNVVVRATETEIKANPDKYKLYIVNKIFYPAHGKTVKEAFKGNDYFKYYDTDEIVDIEE